MIRPLHHRMSTVLTLASILMDGLALTIVGLVQAVL